MNGAGVQTWTCTFWGVQTWKPAGPNLVLGGPNLETCGRFPGPLKRAVFQVWTCQNVQVSRSKPGKGFQDLDPPKRAGFQVWTLQTCRFAGLQVWTPPKQVSRFGPPKTCRFPDLDPPKTCRDPNLETCTFWEVQTWKPARLGGPNLETCTFWEVQTWKPASKPGNVNVSGGPNLETCMFWGFQTWKPAGPNLETACFGGSKPGNVNVLGSKPGNLRQVFRIFETCRFPGLDLPKRAGFQVWTPKRAGLQVCRSPKRAGFQVWSPQNVQVSRFGPPQNVQVSRFGPPKRAGSRSKRACRFPGLDPLNVQVSRFGPPKTMFGGPNLETCTFGGSKPGNLHVLGGPNRSPVKGIAERLWSVHNTTKTTYFTGH